MNPERQPIHDVLYWKPLRSDDDGNQIYSGFFLTKGRFGFGMREAGDGVSDQQNYDASLTDTSLKLDPGTILFHRQNKETTPISSINPDSLYEVGDNITSYDIKGRNQRHRHLLNRFKKKNIIQTFLVWTSSGILKSSSISRTPEVNFPEAEVDDGDILFDGDMSSLVKGETLLSYSDGSLIVNSVGWKLLDNGNLTLYS